jgi:hypothetical protein
MDVVRILARDKAGYVFLEALSDFDAQITGKEGDAVFEQAALQLDDNRILPERLKNHDLTDRDMTEFVLPVFTAFAHLTDPTACHKREGFKYLAWICRTYLAADLNGDPIRPEFLTKIRSDLEDFKRWNRLLDARDINAYPDYASLEEALHPHQLRRHDKRRICEDITVIYQGPEGTILVPHNKLAAIYWGKGTRICFTSTRSDNLFHSLTAHGHPVLIFIPRPSVQERAAEPFTRSFKYAAGFSLGRVEFKNERDKVPTGVPPYLERLLLAALERPKGMSPQALIQHGGFGPLMGLTDS